MSRVVRRRWELAIIRTYLFFEWNEVLRGTTYRSLEARTKNQDCTESVQGILGLLSWFQEGSTFKNLLSPVPLLFLGIENQKDKHPLKETKKTQWWKFIWKKELGYYTP